MKLLRAKLQVRFRNFVPIHFFITLKPVLQYFSLFAVILSKFVENLNIMELDEDEDFESVPKKTKIEGYESKKDNSRFINFLDTNIDKLEIKARPMKKRLIGNHFKFLNCSDLYSQSSKGELEVLTPRSGFTATLLSSPSNSNSNAVSELQLF